MNIHGALNLETFDAPLSNRRPSMGSAPRSFSPGQGLATPDKRIIHVFWHVIWHVIIHVIRDNAACPKGPDVRAFLARSDCRIHLVQLPPYCPHLNPIERLSALIHQHVTHNRHDPTQKQFANAILGFLRETIPNEWKTFPSQVEAKLETKYQTTFASQQSKNMRNSGFSGKSGIPARRAPVVRRGPTLCLVSVQYRPQGCTPGQSSRGLYRDRACRWLCRLQWPLWGGQGRRTGLHGACAP